MERGNLLSGVICNIMRTHSQTVNLKSDIFSPTRLPATSRSSQVTHVESEAAPAISSPLLSSVTHDSTPWTYASISCPPWGFGTTLPHPLRMLGH